MKDSARNRKIKRIRLDRAREFVSQEVKAFCEEQGIELEPSAIEAHEQNGKAERAYRSLRGIASTMIIALGLPEAFWVEA